MSKAVIYVRVSTAEQVDNFSLAIQEGACVEYCAREGFEVDRIFREEGESAKTANRTQLQQMLNYCATEAKRRDIGVVVVYRVDRLARNVYDHAAIRASLNKLKVEFRAVTESFDDSPAGKFMENVMASVAQFDNDMRAARTKAGMKEGLSRGRWMWLAPLGYLNGGSDCAASLVPDPIAGPLVRLGFESVASRRLGRPEVLAELTSLGLVAARGGAVSLQTFGKMLTNPLYMGRVVMPKWDIDVPGDFEPLVSADLFQSVQAVLQGRVASKDSRVRDHPDFPLRRAVRCGRCTAPLTASWSKGRSGRYPYYHCPRKGCGGSNVRKERLEYLFVRQLEARSPRPEVFRLLAAAVEEAWRDRARDARAAQEGLAARLRDLDTRKDRLVDAYLDGRGIDQPTYERKAHLLDRDRAELRRRLEAARPAEVDLAQTIAFAGTLLEDLPGCWNRLDAKQKPQFVTALYPAGLTYRDGTIGTAQTPWWMANSGTASDAGTGLAAPTGFEPVSPP